MHQLLKQVRLSSRRLSTFLQPQHGLNFDFYTLSTVEPCWQLFDWFLSQRRRRIRSQDLRSYWRKCVRITQSLTRSDLIFVCYLRLVRMSLLWLPSCSILKSQFPSRITRGLLLSGSITHPGSTKIIINKWFYHRFCLGLLPGNTKVFSTLTIRVREFLEY